MKSVFIKIFANLPRRALRALLAALILTASCAPNRAGEAGENTAPAPKSLAQSDKLVIYAPGLIYTTAEQTRRGM